MTVQYLIDNSRTFSAPQKIRRATIAASRFRRTANTLRGLSHSFDNAGECGAFRWMSRISSARPVALLPGVLAKGIATDDKGRVYICDISAIQVYDAALETGCCAPCRHCGQRATARGRRGAGALRFRPRRRDSFRWVLKENGDGLSAATLGGFGGTGVFKCRRALRGVKWIEGNIWVVD